MKKGLLLLLLFCGCAAPRFTRDLAFTRQEYMQDYSACEVLSPYSSKASHYNFIRRCMMGKGWQETEKDPAFLEDNPFYNPNLK